MTPTQTYRSRQAALRALVEPQLAAAWTLLDPTRVDDTFPAWNAAVTPIVIGHRTVSYTIAAQYLKDMGVTGAAPVRLPLSVLRSSLVVTGPVSIKQGMTAGKTLERATADALKASIASAVRHVLEGGNETVRVSSVADRKVRGWRRVAAGNACDFCQGKTGTIFTDPDTDFSCHDGCACSVEPVLA